MHGKGLGLGAGRVSGTSGSILDPRGCQFSVNLEYLISTGALLRRGAPL